MIDEELPDEKPEPFDALPLNDPAFDIPPLAPKPGGMGMFKLYDYQVVCVDSIYEAWTEFTSVMIVCATGLGKTVIAAEVVIRWPDTGRILFIAHIKELIDQAHDKIKYHTDQLPAIEMGQNSELKAEHTLIEKPQVLVASIQTMHRRMQKFNPLDFDLIIIDEFHHAASNTYRGLWDYFSKGNPAIKLLGITATPERADNLSLGCMAEHCAFQMGIREGIDGGYLVPIKQRYFVVDGLDFSKCRTLAKDLNEKDLEAAMLGGAETEGMTEEERRELIEKQERMLHSVAAPVVAEAHGRQGIVYCVTVNHAHRMAEVLRRYPGITAEVIHGGTPYEERKEIIQKYRAGMIQFLVNVGVATEGFDVPGVHLIVMARPTKSTGLYTQMLGRATRPAPNLVGQFETPELRQEAIANSIKPFMEVMDFVGNSGKHKLVSSADVLAGDMPEQFVAEAIHEMTETGEAQDIRAAAWKKKQEHDERVAKRQEEERLKKIEREKEQQAREEARRSRIRAEAEYRAKEINPFDKHETAPQRVQSEFRGGSTDGQIGLLKRLGIQEATAMKWSKKQAGAVINDLKNRTGGKFIMRFGKNQGKSLKDLNVDYLKWAGENVHDEEFQNNLQQFREEWKAEHNPRGPETEQRGDTWSA